MILWWEGGREGGREGGEGGEGGRERECVCAFKHLLSGNIG